MRVVGFITSTYREDVTQVQVSALGFDAFGGIVGGGSTMLGFVPGEGQVGVEVPFVSFEPPASVELFAQRTPFSKLE